MLKAPFPRNRFLAANNGGSDHRLDRRGARQRVFPDRRLWQHSACRIYIHRLQLPLRVAPPPGPNLHPASFPLSLGGGQAAASGWQRANFRGAAGRVAGRLSLRQAQPRLWIVDLESECTCALSCRSASSERSSRATWRGAGRGERTQP